MNRPSILKRLYVFIVLLSVLLLPVLGNSVPQKSLEEGEWLNEIVEDLFLNNTMVYTLFGTKPMSGIVQCIATESECIHSAQPYLMTLTEEERCRFLKALREGFENDHFEENYQKWLEFRKTHPSKRFLFRTSLSQNKYYLIIDMINVQETLWTLQKYHALFSKETGLAFEPLKVVWEFENLDSEFWKKVFSSGYLMGILYGFGEKNAYFFSLYRDSVNKIALDTQLVPRRSAGGRSETLSIVDIDIPPFRSFGPPHVEDPVVAQFEAERELIIKNLQGKNFATEVLKRLFDLP